MTITIVGLGPAGAHLMARGAWDAITSAQTLFLRTSRHPAVNELPSSTELISFDDYYEESEGFEDVYERIVSTLLHRARSEDILYAVPGHPFIGESTVTALIAAAEKEGQTVQIIPGLSFVEPVLSLLRVDGLDGLQIFDAIDLIGYIYPPLNADVPLLVGQVYNTLLAGELKIVLMSVYPDDHPVSLVHAAGTVQEKVETIALYQIDRSHSIDHLSSLFVPPLPYKATLPALAETVAILRGPGGCPWDQEQTPLTLRSGFLEEVGEVIEALELDDSDNLREELGDVLYHLVMQIQMATEEGAFTIGDVIAGIEEKLRRRHPHVWGELELSSTAEVLHNWQRLKKEEKSTEPDSFLDNIPRSLSALSQSQKIQDKVREVGFDWPNLEGVFAKIDEEFAELKAAELLSEKQMELGDLLFIIVNLASWLKLDAESALRDANVRFIRRFKAVEAIVSDRRLNWRELDLASLDQLWEEVKLNLAKGE